MALVLNGDGNITGLLAGGLPDGSVTADDIASLPASSVIQVVTATYSTQVTTTSDSYVTTGLSASITPSSASNKILIIYSGAAGSSNASSGAVFTVFRGTVSDTDLSGVTNGFSQLYSASGSSSRGSISINYLDSPSTTSSQTYTIGFKAGNAGHTQTAQQSSALAVITLMEIAA